MRDFRENVLAVALATAIVLFAVAGAVAAVLAVVKGNP